MANGLLFAQIRLMSSCRLERDLKNYDWISDLHSTDAVNHIQSMQFTSLSLIVGAVLCFEWVYCTISISSFSTSQFLISVLILFRNIMFTWNMRNLAIHIYMIETVFRFLLICVQLCLDFSSQPLCSVKNVQKTAWGIYMELQVAYPHFSKYG